MTTATMKFLGVFLFLTGCAARPSSEASPSPPARSTAVTVLRETSYIDTDLAARGLGRLDVVVRSADQPTQALPEALVTIHGREGAKPRPAVANQNGIVRFDTLSVGQYQVEVQRIGYRSTVSAVTITGGCRADLEVYIGIQAIGISPPPPMPGRAILTTCRRQ